MIKFEYALRSCSVKRVQESNFKYWTDPSLGRSTSLIVSWPKRANKEVATELTEQKSAQELLEASARVVAVDPGRNPIFTAVVHNQATLDSLQSPSPENINYEVIKWRKRCFHQEAGYTHHNGVTKLCTGKAPLINEYNAEVLSAKTSSLELFKAYAHHVLANQETVMSFYNSQRFKRLR